MVETRAPHVAVWLAWPHSRPSISWEHWGQRLRGVLGGALGGIHGRQAQPVPAQCVWAQEGGQEGPAGGIPLQQAPRGGRGAAEEILHACGVMHWDSIRCEAGTIACSEQECCRRLSDKPTVTPQAHRVAGQPEEDGF